MQLCLDHKVGYSWELGIDVNLKLKKNLTRDLVTHMSKTSAIF